MRVADLRPHHWVTFRDRLKMFDNNIGVTTRNLMLTRMQAMFNWCVSAELINANPLARIKQEPKKPRRESTITGDQLTRMLAANQSPIFHAYMLAASDSGMRNAEVRMLKWDQIDIETGRVKLSWTATKTKRSRIARLSPRAIAALLALPRLSEYVFVSPKTGLVFSPRAFWGWFRAAAKVAGIEAASGDGRITFHDATRHTFASRMHEAGATVKEIQVALGHASIQTTALYLHTNEDALDKAHALLHALLHKAKRKGPKKR